MSDAVVSRLSGCWLWRLFWTRDSRFLKPYEGRREKLNSRVCRSSTDRQLTTQALTDGENLWDLLDIRVSEAQRVQSATADATVEVRRYLSDSYLPRTEDPLLYWEKHVAVYPHLYNLAKKYLSLPATSVPCERIFSKAGEVISRRRSRLKPSTAEKILFLNMNL
ncbi:hypothetical protein SKAU_G00159930 [Synaphobranchus kaupii]|uniref:HAT C-terminal dimerisation domain-containing protein n=1 Tax=Synaphobranchus kaupii TaxID=118154 RepID=A0A9Q1FIA9_SYNKA|nr:hypothetical protein SKAU_G00159930 [Synaphobranchus kaupii]